MKQKEYEETMVWSGNCADCFAVYHVSAHPESSVETAEMLEEGPNEWENMFASCFICEGGIDWNGSDPRRAVFKNA